MLAAAVAAICLGPALGTAELNCKPLEEAYPTPQDLAGFWHTAFRYVAKTDPEYEFAYSMTFFGDNPNSDVTEKRLADPTFSMNITDETECHLGEYAYNNHHEKPQPQGSEYNECFPWHESSCCKAEQVNDKFFKTAYGQEWAWDNCGKLSPECERFFVQESCFYECDIAAGLFRKYHPENGNCNSSHPNCHDDTWIIENVPIKGDFFDAMHRACAGQPICSLGYFECSEEYVAPTQSPTNPPQVVEKLSPGSIVGIVALSLLLLAGVIFMCHVVKRERQGSPVFAPLEKPELENQSSSNGRFTTQSSFEVEHESTEVQA
jgi:folate receptor